MSDKYAGSVHWSFWLIGVVGLVWNVMGILNYFMQTNADPVVAMNEVQRAIIEGRPAWATGAFAIAVFGGALGCLLLLLRKSAAIYFLVASLLGVIVQWLPHLGLIGSTTNDTFQIVMYILSPLVVAIFLIWYAKLAGRKGWIR
jgi:hypothetical protein